MWVQTHDARQETPTFHTTTHFCPHIFVSPTTLYFLCFLRYHRFIFSNCSSNFSCLIGPVGGLFTSQRKRRKQCATIETVNADLSHLGDYLNEEVHDRNIHTMVNLESDGTHVSQDSAGALGWSASSSCAVQECDGNERIGLVGREPVGGGDALDWFGENWLAELKSHGRATLCEVWKRLTVNVPSLFSNLSLRTVILTQPRNRSLAGPSAFWSLVLRQRYNHRERRRVAIHTCCRQGHDICAVFLLTQLLSVPQSWSGAVSVLIHTHWRALRQNGPRQRSTTDSHFVPSPGNLVLATRLCRERDVSRESVPWTPPNPYDVVGNCLGCGRHKYGSSVFLSCGLLRGATEPTLVTTEEKRLSDQDSGLPTGSCRGFSSKHASGVVKTLSGL